MKKIVTFGEIMLRLATPGHLRFAQTDNYEASFGGGEANVAVSLAQFGLPVQYVTRLPSNDLGDAAINRLRSFGVDTSEIIRSEDRMGIYFLETGASQRGSKVLYDRSDSAFANFKPGMINWKEVFREASWFHWTGITPAISQGAAAACLEAVMTASHMGIVISTDLNYRSKLWKWGKEPGLVMEELVKHSDIILGNEEDADKIFGIKPRDSDVTAGKISAEGYENVARVLGIKFPKCKKVVITLRTSHNANYNSWSGIMFNGNETILGDTYDITHIVDRVGGGDAFMAGLIYGLVKFRKDDKAALNFAIAASCLKHTVKGDFNLVSKDEVLKLMEGDASGRVVR